MCHTEETEITFLCTALNIGNTEKLFKWKLYNVMGPAFYNNSCTRNSLFKNQ